MTKQEKGFTLKVCRTCRYWSDKQKGVCSRLQQGVGQFWMCEDWTELTEDSPNFRETQGQKPSQPG